MDTTSWIPMRWPCGPLGLARELAQGEVEPDRREGLERWTDPLLLERLEGTSINCLVVPWADGTPEDATHQRTLAPLITAADRKGLAVVGHAAETADLRAASGAANAAGIAALATESREPDPDFPILRFGELSAADRSPRPFVGVDDLPWPGMKLDSGQDFDGISGPTGPPWVDSNTWVARLIRTVLRPQACWLAFEPPREGRPESPTAYAQALADAWAYGARWVISLDADARLDVARGNGRGAGILNELGRCIELFARHRAWLDCIPAATLGLVSDFAGDNEFLAFEAANLLSRQSRFYRVIHRDDAAADPLDGLKAMVYADAAPPDAELRDKLYAFAEAGGTLIAQPGWEERGERLPAKSFPRFRLSRCGRGRLAVAVEELDDPFLLAEDAQALMSHRHDLVRIFNPGLGRFGYARSTDGRSAVLHLFPYVRFGFEYQTSVWFHEPWRTAALWRVGDEAPVLAERAEKQAGVEFHLPPEPHEIKPRSTNSDPFVLPGAAYSAIELSA